jgi:PD-(D/E)XK nuclease family transposase
LFSDQEYFAIYFVEFNKLQTQGALPKTQLERWLLFLKTYDDKVLEELKMANPNLAKAVTEIEIAKMSKVQRMRYEARVAGEIDRATIKLIDEMEAQKREEEDKKREEEDKKREEEDKKRQEEYRIKDEEYAKKDQESDRNAKLALVRGKLSLLQRLVLKRFPDFTLNFQEKFSCLSEKQVDELTFLLLDCGVQSEFEKALQDSLLGS